MFHGYHTLEECLLDVTLMGDASIQRIAIITANHFVRCFVLVVYYLDIKLWFVMHLALLHTWILK
jgi:hypothetical protein